MHETIESVQRRTAANLTYIGEWHTHPEGMGSRPSSDDAVLLRWIEKVLVFSDVPALMMIGRRRWIAIGHEYGGRRRVRDRGRDLGSHRKPPAWAQRTIWEQASLSKDRVQAILTAALECSVYIPPSIPV